MQGFVLAGSRPARPRVRVVRVFASGTRNIRRKVHSGRAARLPLVHHEMPSLPLSMRCEIGLGADAVEVKVSF